MMRLLLSAIAVLTFASHAPCQETQDRAERLGRLPAELIKNKKTDAEILEALCLATLARLPKDQEKDNVMQHIKKTANRQAACEDVLWALINTKEFATVNGMTLDQMMQFSEKVTAAMHKK